jgi:hypothetical protein
MTEMRVYESFFLCHVGIETSQLGLFTGFGGVPCLISMQSLVAWTGVQCMYLAWTGRGWQENLTHLALRNESSRFLFTSS